MATIKSLAPGDLYKHTDPGLFSFETTEEMADFSEIIGQPRAVQAIKFGIGMEKDGYNLFALGPSGSGKRSLVTHSFEQQAKSEPTPDDWCYVYNFEQEHKPNAIRLPAGKGTEFQHDMSQFVEELRTTLSAAFESDEYRARRQVVEEEIQERNEKALDEIQARAKDQSLALLRTPGGLVFAPVRDGEVMPPEEFQKLPEEERQSLESNVAELQAQLQKVLQMVPVWQREMRQRVRGLNQEITTIAVNGLMNELHLKYAEILEVPGYLDAVQRDIVAHASDFLVIDQSPGGESEPAMPAVMDRNRRELSPLRRYEVNLFVAHHASQGAPVIYEDNPTYQNLIGRVEHMAHMGALVADFILIKPGSLHLANGGYLILDARKVLLQPYAWDALKRSLESRQARLDSLGQMLGLISTISLEPEPIPLNVKVALLGDRPLYYLLSELDPEFDELFKVQMEFDDQMSRNEENEELYARVIGSLARKEHLRPLDRAAVARVIEHSARLAGDAQKLSVQVKNVIDLLREGDYWAGEHGHHNIQASDLQKAIDTRIFRADRLQERYQENILRETIMIATDGSQVGQVNGLSVIQMGNFAFGTPSRITARVRRGKGEVVNIEREVELSGPIHSKGVLILSGFLGARYAAETPLSLSASLVFEQSYSGVEGDSASSAELYSLLSALAELPIRQSLAVTGSVNQHGQVQAIGGVNEKIEGFFDICNARGLTGEQGVLIPISNVKHLMLQQEVIDAVAAGKFHIFPITTIDQGIEVLTGIPAGKADENGKYPDNTVNGRVQARLAKLAEKNEGEVEDGKEDAT